MDKICQNKRFGHFPVTRKPQTWKPSWYTLKLPLYNQGGEKRNTFHVYSIFTSLKLGIQTHVGHEGVEVPLINPNPELVASLSLLKSTHEKREEGPGVEPRTSGSPPHRTHMARHAAGLLLAAVSSPSRAYVGDVLGLRLIFAFYAVRFSELWFCKG